MFTRPRCRSHGLNYPLGGQLRAGVRHEQLREWTDDPRAYILEMIIAQATEHRPEDRPTMRMVSELRAWLDGPADPVVPGDLSGYTARLEALRVPSVCVKKAASVGLSRRILYGRLSEVRSRPSVPTSNWQTFPRP